MITETQRILLRELEPADWDALCRILQDEETMYAYNGAFSLEETRKWLDNQFSRYQKYGFGLWAAVRKASGEMIGQCGLTMQPWNGQEFLEVGYLFQRAFWHQGYATESAKACIEYAFRTLRADEVCSIIRDTNLPSQKVALRNGMTPKDTAVKFYRGVEMPHTRYVISRSRWEASHC